MTYEPEFTNNGVGYCVESCPEHDGKRCRLLGRQPSSVCEPWAADLVKRARSGVLPVHMTGGVVVDTVGARSPGGVPADLVLCLTDSEGKEKRVRYTPEHGDYIVEAVFMGCEGKDDPPECLICEVHTKPGTTVQARYGSEAAARRFERSVRDQFNHVDICWSGICKSAGLNPVAPGTLATLRHRLGAGLNSLEFALSKVLRCEPENLLGKAMTLHTRLDFLEGWRQGVLESPPGCSDASAQLVDCNAALGAIRSVVGCPDDLGTVEAVEVLAAGAMEAAELMETFVEHDNPEGAREVAARLLLALGRES